MTKPYSNKPSANRILNMFAEVTNSATFREIDQALSNEIAYRGAISKQMKPLLQHPSDHVKRYAQSDSSGHSRTLTFLYTLLDYHRQNDYQERINEGQFTRECIERYEMLKDS